MPKLSPRLSRICTFYYTICMNFKQHKTGTAIACWFAVLLGFLILFLVKKDDIFSTLKETRFFSTVFGKEPDFILRYDPKKTVTPPSAKTDEAPPSAFPYNEDKPLSVLPAEKNTARPPELAESQEHLEERAVKDTAKTKAKLWFVEITAEGTVSRKEVSRMLPAAGAPLTQAIQALLAGPGSGKPDNRVRTLIPDGSRLLSASVSGGVARLSFSEEFQWNSAGIEGYMAQLMQVVYTATAIPGVRSVQFLIDGELREYIGGEGIGIGMPLTRSFFQ